jgi:hypothetical protein
MLFNDALRQLSEMYVARVGKGTQKDKRYRNRPLGKDKVPKRMTGQKPPSKSDRFEREKDKI